MTILDRIVERKCERLDALKRATPLADLRRDVEAMPPQAPGRFAGALREPGLSVIAEIKWASPSAGVIRQADDRDAATREIAQQYTEAGAAAISVLTEEDFFDGGFHYFDAAHAAVRTPLLMKDFVVDPYQLYQARLHGASAVLLIATLLDAHQLRDLHQQAEALGLDALVELYAADELDRVDTDAVRVLGVNNRDLRTFEVDLDHCLRVFERLPANVVRVAESGIRTAADLQRLAEGGADAALIGETFMRADHPGAALQDLLSHTEA